MNDLEFCGVTLNRPSNTKSPPMWLHENNIVAKNSSEQTEIT